jgi:hypothetical protein
MTPADSGAVAPASSLSTARPEESAGADVTWRSVSDMGHLVPAEAGGGPSVPTQWRETANEEMR